MGILRPSLTQTHNGVGGQRGHPDTRQMVVNPTINVQKVLRGLWRREKFFLAGVGWKRLHPSSNGDPPKRQRTLPWHRRLIQSLWPRPCTAPTQPQWEKGSELFLRENSKAVLHFHLRN